MSKIKNNNTDTGKEEELIKNEEEVLEEFIDLNEEGEEFSGKDIVKNLRVKIKKLESEKAEYLNSWQRSAADYKNREMQIEKDKKEWGDIAVKRFAEDLLIVNDTYDAARSNKSAWESVDSNWRGGIEYIFDTFENKLKEKGFEKFGKVGDALDPAFHEGLGAETLEENNTDKENKENKENTVSTLIISGYKYKGSVIRPAKVKIWVK